MSRRIWLYSGLVILLLCLACGPKVMIPPEVDLRKYDRVGLIGFGCNAEGNMDEFVTRWLLMTIRKYQKAARIIELGSEEEVLESVEADQLDSDAIQAIGGRYNVNAVFTGNLEVTEVQPLLVLYPGGPRPMMGKKWLEGKRVNAMVKVWITARLWETKQGGTFWRVSVSGEEMVNQVSAVSDGKIIFDARDPRQAYWDLVNPLVKKICADFKIKHVRIQEK
jgi:hypothetical protein